MLNQVAKPTTVAIRVSLIITFFALPIANLAGWAPAARARGFEGVICNAPIAIAGLACLALRRTRGAARSAWVVMGAALVVYAFAGIYSSYLLQAGAGYPSPADAMFLAFYVLAGLALSIMLRTAAQRGTTRELGLEGAVVGSGVAALASAVVLGPLITIGEGKLLAVLTNLAYPLADLGLIALLVGVGYTLPRRTPRWWMLNLGVVGFFVADCIYLHQVANGTWVPMGYPGMLWTGGAVLIGFAATLSPRALSTRPTEFRRLTLPSLASLMAIILLGVGQWRSLPPVTVALAAFTILLAFARLAMLMREVRGLSESRREARTDFLTQLPNRRQLAESLAIEMVSTNATHSLLVLDIDGFKEINDSLGHVEGDRLLRLVGQRLAEADIGRSMLSRLGGDEFAVLIPGADASKAARAAIALRQSLEATFELAGLPIRVQASIGVATSPGHGTTPDELLASADIAMYQAKRCGSGIAVLQADDDNPSMARLRLINELPAALERGEIVGFYQPIVRLHDRAVVGVECLARWRHPTLGTLGPNSFLRMTQQLGLMPVLTTGILSQSVNDVAHLADIGFDLYVSVNISALDLLNTTLASDVRMILDQSPTRATAIVFEVTEDAVMEDLPRSSETLAMLRSLGARIAIDDYGTGQASLAYLRDLPVDLLKLDRSFQMGRLGDNRNTALVRSTLDLARTLNLAVIAEGIESQDVADHMSALGCALGQGYLWAKPMPLDELVGWLRMRRPVHAA